jgi:hypothetical protein
MTSQYGAYAFRAGLTGLYARMRIHTPTRPGTHMHARTRKHAHTDQCVIFIAFPQQQWFRERASVPLPVLLNSITRVMNRNCLIKRHGIVTQSIQYYMYFVA